MVDGVSSVGKSLSAKVLLGLEENEVIVSDCINGERIIGSFHMKSTRSRQNLKGVPAE